MEDNKPNIISDTQKNGVIEDLRQIIEHGRSQAYASANQIVIQTYWNIGRRIVEEEQHGEQRAKYGKRLIATLAEQLSQFGILPSILFMFQEFRNCEHMCSQSNLVAY